MLSYDLECPTIDGELFSIILDLFFEQSDYFSFSNIGIPNTDCSMQKDLEAYVYREIHSSHWFRYSTLPDDPITNILYFANSATLTILKKYCNRLFLFDSECTSTSWNQSLENLCFFFNDRLILGTVSHEHICKVFPPDENFKNELFGMYAYWKEDHDFTEQIKLSDYLTK